MLLKCCQTEKKTRTFGTTQKRSAGSSMRLTTTSDSAPRAQRKVVRAIAPKRTHRGVKEEPAVDPICDNSNDSGLGFEQHQEYNVALRLVDPESTWAGDRLGLSRDPNWSNGNSRLGWASESPEVKRKRLEIKIESDDANDDFSFPESVRQTTQLILPSPPYSVDEHMSAPRPVKRPGQFTQRRLHTNVTSTQLLGIHKDSKPPRGRVPGPNILATRNKNTGPNVIGNQILGLNGKARGKAAPNLASSQTAAVSRNGKTQLNIVSQPEQQHRARYQTEGSRGAVKDRTANGFPQVQLSNWLGPATLEVYIGSDCGKVVPHMFYQACRVSGKNSTQCQERTEDGTVIIEVQFEPAKDMVVTCDCVGILKERNVDVEHRFPDQSGSRNKKKSTRCRMVFRTTLTHADGSRETLQICSQPIACTQPPGVPEICKKSLTSSPACGGQELFILGKNFLKDTRVLLSNPDLQPPWEASVIPDKEYLQQSHLVCVVPPYHTPNISKPVTVRLTVVSSGKSSEAHCFVYTPQPPVGTAEEEHNPTKEKQPVIKPSTLPPSGATLGTEVITPDCTSPSLRPALNGVANAPTVNLGVEPVLAARTKQYLIVEPKKGTERDRIFPVLMWKSAAGSEDMPKITPVACKGKELKLLSLPAARKELQLTEPPALVPLQSRQPSISEVKSEVEDGKCSPSMGLCTPELKGVDLRTKSTTLDSASPTTSRLKVSMATGADLSNTLPPSMATLRRFVANDNGSPLPSLSVENFLSRLERKPEGEKHSLKGDVLSQTDSKLVNGNVVVSQPGFIPLEAVISANTRQAVSLSNLQQLSGEEMSSTSTAPAHSIHGKPLQMKPKPLTPLLSDLHMTSMFSSQPTLENVSSSGSLSAVSSAGHLLDGACGQIVFPMQSNLTSYENGPGPSELESSLASTDVRLVTTSGHTMSVAGSSLVSVTQGAALDSLGTPTIDAGNRSEMTNEHKLKELAAIVANSDMINAVTSICTPKRKSGAMQSQLNTYNAEHVDNMTSHSPPVVSSETATLPNYVKDAVTSVHPFPITSDVVASQSQNTTFNSYVPKNEESSLLSQPIKTKSFIMPLQDPTYDSHSAVHANSVSPLNTCNNIKIHTSPISTSCFVTGTTTSTCSLPVTHVPTQVLPELNDHSAMAFHSNLSPIIEKNMLLKGQNSTPLNSGFLTETISTNLSTSLNNGYIGEHASLNSCSPPIPRKNILIRSSHGHSFFDDYVAGSLSVISVSNLQMSKENNIVVESCHTLPLSSCSTESQTLANTNISSLPLPSNDIVVTSDVSKSHNDLGIENALAKTSNSPLIGVTTTTCSPSADCSNMFITSHDSVQVRNHELLSPTKTVLDNSLPVASASNYNLSLNSRAHSSQSDVVDSAIATTLTESYATHCVSVDTRLLDAGLRQEVTIDTPNPILVSSACTVPPTIDNILASSIVDSGRNQLLDSTTSFETLMHNSSLSGQSVSNHCTLPVAIKNITSRSASMDGEQNVVNVSTSSLGMSDMILCPATAMKSESNMSNHCTPSIAMKNLILNCGPLSIDKCVPNTCVSPAFVSSLNEAGPVATAYGKVIPERAAQIAIKDMMLRVDVSSTMDDQMMTQPGAITPETVRLDALVNSTLDNHIHATRSPQATRPSSMAVTTLHATTVDSTSNPSIITTSSTLLGNMFPSNDPAKETRAGNLQATTMQPETLQFTPAPRLMTCSDLLQQVTSASSSTQFNSCSDISHVSNGMEFRSEPSASSCTDGGFGVISMDAQFGVTSDQRFTSAPISTQFQSVPSSSQFSCTSSNSRDMLCDLSKKSLSQLMDLEERRAKTEAVCVQKEECSLKEGGRAVCQEGVAVRERREEGMLPQELTQMSDHDLISYINPSCFDQV